MLFVVITHALSSSTSELPNTVTRHERPLPVTLDVTIAQNLGTCAATAYPLWSHEFRLRWNDMSTSMPAEGTFATGGGAARVAARVAV